MGTSRLREGWQRFFGLPGRAWASTPELSRLGTACGALDLLVAVALGPALLTPWTTSWPLGVVLALALLWVGAHPLTFHTAGIGVEIVLKSGFFVLAVAGYGPPGAVGYWFAASLLVELALRHNLALATVNLAIAALSAAAGAAVAALVPDASPWVAGAATGAAVGVVETLASLAGAGYLGGWRERAPLREALQGGVVGTVLGALCLLSAERLGVLVTAVVASVPLALLARLVRIEQARREDARRAERIVDALTALASVDTREHAQQVALAAAHELSSAGDPLLVTERHDAGPTVHHYDLGPIPVDGPAAGRTWLRVERRRYKIRTPASDVDALQTLATAARAACARIAERERIHWQARHDPLTGLLDRNGWWQHTVLGPERQHDTAVLLLDLDGFKAVNDVHGHAVGDAVLREVGAELARLVPPGAAVARWGGDEFVVHLAPERTGVDLDELGFVLVEGVRAAAARVTDLPVAASVGIATAHPDDGIDGLDLLSRADAAMYAAKRAGKATVRHEPRAGAGR